MSIKNMTKEELELLSHKDMTNMLLEENGSMNTTELFKTITTLLELPQSVFENKIGDYYTSLTTDKRFILLEDGSWDLRNKHTSDKVVAVVDDEDEIDETEEEEENHDEKEGHVSEEDKFDVPAEEDDYDDSDDDLKGLVVIDEDELEMDE